MSQVWFKLSRLRLVYFDHPKGIVAACGRSLVYGTLRVYLTLTTLERGVRCLNSRQLYSFSLRSEAVMYSTVGWLVRLAAAG